ncbi:MAG: proline racemase family protein [Planctomycetota bacterium]
MAVETLRVLDSHTGGEPTRVVIDPPFELRGETLADQCQDFRMRCDHYRRAIACEPRSSDVAVGALLLPPINESSVASVVFFNNVSTLGMCGHGTIGLAVTLHHLGKIGLGEYSLDTPVGPVQFELLSANEVRIRNVPSYRLRKQVGIKLKSGQALHGDIAWGGNWFFICSDHNLLVEPGAISELNSLANEIRCALDREGITGAEGNLIDHIELVGPPSDSAIADSRNFVLCPGGAYDRSPCGTGTSAKVACLAADGLLDENVWYRQQSVIGSVFRAKYDKLAEFVLNGESRADAVLPTLEGSAYLTADTQLVLDSKDPFCFGFSGEGD